MNLATSRLVTLMICRGCKSSTANPVHPRFPTRKTTKRAIRLHRIAKTVRTAHCSRHGHPPNRLVAPQIRSGRRSPCCLSFDDIYLGDDQMDVGFDRVVEAD